MNARERGRPKSLRALAVTVVSASDLLPRCVAETLGILQGNPLDLLLLRGRKDVRIGRCHTILLGGHGKEQQSPSDSGRRVR